MLVLLFLRRYFLGRRFKWPEPTVREGRFIRHGRLGVAVSDGRPLPPGVTKGSLAAVSGAGREDITSFEFTGVIMTGAMPI